ncbi:MAG: flagellar biosynthesis anti-sigma factor FlgM [Anaeromyxobacteraceae bacterium]|jgi:negative regulator of flagellin synthesis FlgM|nr:flagellar biosynthesis anti-sigma factor FlgM [Anaeromyxobacteraceae bacterium]
MKVKDASELRGIEANRPPEPKKKTESTTSSASSDKVSNEVKAQVAAAAAAARGQVGNDRSVRLEAIEAAVRQGAFKPDPNRIAQRILDDAELTAKIQALMKR